MLEVSRVLVVCVAPLGLLLGSIVHPRRMFHIYDRMGEYLRAWKRNRESERQGGLLAKRETLPIPYTRHTSERPLSLGTDEAQTDEAQKAFTEQIEEMELLQYFAAYWAWSRQIFSFDPALTAALRRPAMAADNLRRFISVGAMPKPRRWLRRCCH